MTSAIEYLDRAIDGFDRDPPDSDFQRGYLEALKVVRAEAFSPSSGGFAKLFDTERGQLLGFLDNTDEGDPAITVVLAPVRGVTVKAKLSGWPDGEEGQLRNFAKLDAAFAEQSAEQLYQTADSMAPQVPA